MIKELEYKKFAIIMAGILFLEFIAAKIFWNPTGYQSAVAAWKLFYFVYLYFYIKTLNKTCKGDDQVSNNAFVVIILGTITFTLYYFYWIHKQGVRMQNRARDWKVYLTDNQHKTKICLVVYWIIAYFQSKAFEPYNLYGVLDRYGLIADPVYIFYDFALVAVLLLLAYWMTRDLNILVVEHNRRNTLGLNQQNYVQSDVQSDVSTSTITNNNPQTITDNEITDSHMPKQEWYCTQCGTKNKVGTVCCTQCGKFK